MLTFFGTYWFLFLAIALAAYGTKLLGLLELWYYHHTDFFETFKVGAVFAYVMTVNGTFGIIGWITALVMMASGHN